MTSEIEAASRALNEEMEPSPKEMAELAARYQALRVSSRLTKDGDILSEQQYSRERDGLTAQLKLYIERHGPLHVEGIGTLRLQERRETVYDLAAILDDDPVSFARMAELGCLKVDAKVMKAQIAAGNIFAPRQKLEQITAYALIVEDER